MKLTLRDAVAVLFMAAILVPYAGYLIRGDMPFIQDPRGMSATALVLGTAAYLTAGRFTTATTIGKTEISLGIVTLALGLIALSFAEAAAAETLLGVFIAALVVTWGVQLLHHAGVLHGRTTPTALPHR